MSAVRLRESMQVGGGPSVLIEIIVAVSVALLVGLCLILVFTHQPRRHPLHQLVELAEWVDRSILAHRSVPSPELWTNPRGPKTRQVQRNANSVHFVGALSILDARTGRRHP